LTLFATYTTVRVRVP